MPLNLFKWPNDEEEGEANDGPARSDVSAALDMTDWGDPSASFHYAQDDKKCAQDDKKTWSGREKPAED